MVAASAPVDRVPLICWVPLQPSEAVQELAPDELQISVEALPLATVAGLAVRSTAGATGGITATVAVPCALPPVPEQVSV